MLSSVHIQRTEFSENITRFRRILTTRIWVVVIIILFRV